MTLCDNCNNCFDFFDKSTHELKQGCGEIYMTKEQSDKVMNGEVNECMGFIES